jgi:hypothetical protein
LRAKVAVLTFAHIPTQLEIYRIAAENNGHHDAGSRKNADAAAISSLIHILTKLIN